MNEKTEIGKSEEFFKKHAAKLYAIYDKYETIKTEKCLLLAENQIFSDKIQKEIDAHQKTIDNLQSLIVYLDYRATNFSDLNREEIELKELILKKKCSLSKIQEKNKKLEFENKGLSITQNETHLEISKIITKMNQEEPKVLNPSGLTLEEIVKRDIISYQKQMLEMDEEIRIEIQKGNTIREIINKIDHEPYKINREYKKKYLMNKKDLCFNHRKLNKNKIPY